MEEKPFIDWNLHDASLQNIDINWAGQTCDLLITVFVSSPIDSNTTSIAYKIHFEKVHSVSIPFSHPWGDSNFINCQKTGDPNEYIIEMQSGDVIRVNADKVLLSQ